jgi:hypothetical protein
MRTRTWVILIEQGIGHEYANTTSETEFYGLFTKEEAISTAEALTRILDDGETEPEIATAMPLEMITPAALLRMKRKEMKQRNQTQE